MLITTVNLSTSYTGTFQKGFSGIFLNTVNALNGAERISVYVESKSDNKYIINDMALKDVLFLASYQDNSKLKAVGLTGTTYAIEFTADKGCVPLVDGEQLRVKLTGLTSAANNFNIYSIESPFDSSNLYMYEEKQFPAGEKVRAYDLSTYDLFGVDMCTQFTDVTLRWSNGASTKMTAEEFQASASCLDDELFNNPPTADSIAVLPVGRMYEPVVINGHQGILTVMSIELTKPSANTVTCIFRKDISDIYRYNN